MSASSSSLQTELRVVNPATLAEVAVVAATEPDGIGEIVAEARLAQERWAREPFARRTRVLRDAAHVLLQSGDEIAGTIVAETGKPRLEAITTELFVCLDTLVWLARHAERALPLSSLRS
jgi:acyl-CoA reductase-like NAD-dependent aldehyde dehydrogenase